MGRRLGGKMYDREDPWDRLPGESSKAYIAFCVYRDLGTDRSIVKALKTSGKPAANLRQWEYWSSKHQWVDRATAYDEHNERRRLVQRERARREMEQRQARIGMLAQNVGAKGLESLSAKARLGELNLNARDSMRLVEGGARLEAPEAVPAAERPGRVAELPLGQPDLNFRTRIPYIDSNPTFSG